ncbi:MAG: hypothetical protein ACE5HB_00665 [Terriglobia bacterium]
MGGATPLPSQEKAAADHGLAPGVVVPRVACLNNSEQTYALYLPSNYAPDRRWPILYAFDPVARGRLPVNLLREAAEQYGYIVVGSNNSRNGFIRLQLEAAQAVWDDTHARFSLDDRRVYATGFSGGARLAARLALSCNGCIAGVIAQGAGFPSDVPLPVEVKFVYFATVGELDFNYTELVRLGQKLDDRGVTNRLRQFEGPHHWAPTEIQAEALAWMELVAMKEGRRLLDSEFVQRQLEQTRARAKTLEQTGNLLAAHYQYRKLVQDFQGLADVSAFADKAAELERAPAVRQAHERQEKELRFQERIKKETLPDLSSLEAHSRAAQKARARLQRKIRDLKETLAKRDQAEARAERPELDVRLHL